MMGYISMVQCMPIQDVCQDGRPVNRNNARWILMGTTLASKSLFVLFILYLYNPSFWNKTTLMRYGKGREGLVAGTLKPSTVKRWALSLHITSWIESDIEEMRHEQGKTQAMVHKEEMPGRIADTIYSASLKCA